MDPTLRARLKLGLVVLFVLALIDGVVTIVISQVFVVNKVVFFGGIALLVIAIAGIIFSSLGKLPLLREAPPARSMLLLMFLWYLVAILATVGIVLNPTIPLHFVLPIPWMLGGFFTYLLYLVKRTAPA